MDVAHAGQFFNSPYLIKHLGYRGNLREKLLKAGGTHLKNIAAI